MNEIEGMALRAAWIFTHDFKDMPTVLALELPPRNFIELQD
jgi:hypothetical protein